MMSDKLLNELCDVTRKAMADRMYKDATDYSAFMKAFGYVPPPPMTRWQRLRMYVRRIPQAWHYIRTGDWE